MRIWKIACAALGISLSASGGRTVASDSSTTLKTIITKMMSCDYSSVHDANKELRKLEIDEAGAFLLLDAAARTPECSDLEIVDSSGYFIKAAARGIGPQHYATILHNYAKFRRDGKWEAIRILLLAGTFEAYKTLQNLMQETCERGDFELTPGMSNSLSGNKDAADLPFVECLIADLRNGRPVNFEVGLVVLAHLQQRWISVERKEPLSPLLLTHIPQLLRVAGQMQQSSGEAWKWEEKYMIVRAELSLLLDIYSSSTQQIDEKLLREILTFADAKLLLFASTALLANNYAVTPEIIRRIGADVEVRNALFDRLRELGIENLFPSEFNNQRSLAEGDLVRWLTFPTELGRAPDKTKFLEMKQDANGDYMYYFAFMTKAPHWSAEDGWMSGWSGPFPKSGELKSHGRQTFSEFESLK